MSSVHQALTAARDIVVGSPERARGYHADFFTAALEEYHRIVAERDRYQTALNWIRHREGQVCDDFELCDHRSCASSIGAWFAATAALDGKWEEFVASVPK